MAETPKTPEKKLFEVTSKIIKLRDPAKQESSTTTAQEPRPHAVTASGRDETAATAR